MQAGDCEAKDEETAKERNRECRKGRDRADDVGRVMIKGNVG